MLTSPIDILKSKRQAELDSAATAKKANDDALIASLMKEVHAHAGHDIDGHFLVRLKSAEPPVLEIEAQHHIPIKVTFNPLMFHVLRGRGVQKFDRLDDALIGGQPLKPRQNTVAVPFKFDTTTKKEDAT